VKYYTAMARFERDFPLRWKKKAEDGRLGG
jgi:hypothetical protein